MTDKKPAPLFIVCLFFCATASAQSSSWEVVRITDSVGYEIDAAERERYALFLGYRNFLRATFLSRGEQYLLRISYQKEDKRLTEDVLLSKEQFATYRNQIEAVDQAIESSEQTEIATEAQKEGRLRIATNALFYGLFLYGPGINNLLEIKGTQAEGVGLLTAGGSFLAALSATREYRLGYGRANLLRWGSYAGTLYGLGIPVFFESENEKAYVGSAMLATPLGGLLAHRLSSHRWFERGETDLITTGGWVGGLYGAAIPFLIDIENLRNRTQAKIYVASAMLGVPAGVTATTRLVRHRPINRGRAHLITLGGVAGGYYSASLVNLAGVDAEEHLRVYVVSIMVGLPIGAYFGHRWTGQETYTLGRARLTSVGAYAGALFGSGFVLATGTEKARPYVLATVVGSAVGIWYAHRATRGWGERVTLKSDRRMPSRRPVTVSLPSPATLFSFGMLSLRNPSFSENMPLELIRISF